MIAATVAVSVLAVMSLSLMRELKAKDELMRKKGEERTLFAADMAHELRTPLAMMRAHLDLLGSPEAISPLVEDVNRVTRIVEQVLTKSQIENIEIQPGEQVDLVKLSSSVAAYLAPLIIREGRSIEVIGAQNPVFVNGHAFGLEQALRNLLENAMKYSARGSTITIEVDESPALHIIDRGRGIPMADRERIFERFHRADRRTGGSGLGLYIVRRVAEAHNAKVSIEDAPGGGSVFVLQFSKK
jgi:signal transduction histidine kinase